MNGNDGEGIYRDKFGQIYYISKTSQVRNRYGMIKISDIREFKRDVRKIKRASLEEFLSLADKDLPKTK